MVDQTTKNKILADFKDMRAIEQDAHDFYVRASDDRLVTEEVTKEQFLRIADDEAKHVRIVDEIIHIVENCM